MDPVTAVGLASNIFQLIGVARGVALTTRDLYKSKTGLSKEIDRFRIQAELVRKHLDELTRGTSTKPDDVALREYAQAMCTRTTEYLATLDSVKIRDTSSWWNAFGAAVKSWWKKEQFAESFKAIEEAGTNITTYIVTTKIPAMQVDISRIHKHTLLMEANVEQKMQELCSQIRENTVINKSHGNDILQAFDNWFAQQGNAKKQRQCLQALYFPKIENRVSEVKDAHRKTFDWIMEDSQPAPDEPQKMNFRHWLHSQDRSANVFWVSGKPGSGKSTLIKYLKEEPRLREHLDKWVGDDTLIIAGCFFWRHGDRVQRSINGLLRSLLYHILSNRPKLVPAAFLNPEWLFGGNAYEFSRKALEDAFKRLIDTLGDEKVRLFIMIDGLDEFDDREEHGPTIHDQHELIELLSMFRDRDSIKLCVSSRPLPIFRQEYGQDASRCIRVQDLTADDIRIYVKEKLESSLTFQKLAENDRSHAMLVNEIVDAAHGVFLWVHLAVRSLLQGITNEDGVSSLRARLRQLPPELDDLFKHILSSIDLTYQRSSALMLLAHRHCSALTSGSLFYHFMDDDEHDALMKAKELEKFNYLQLLDIRDKAGERINVYCQGLLEYTRATTATIHPCHHFPLVRPVQIGHAEEFFEGTVEFCHRSVAEFIDKPENMRSLLKYAQTSQEQLYFLYCRSSVAILKALFLLIGGTSVAEFGFLGYKSAKALIELFMRFADFLETDVMHLLREEVECLLVRPSFEGGHSLLNRIIYHSNIFCWSRGIVILIPESNVLAFMVCWNEGLNYIKARIEGNPKLLETDAHECSMLYTAVLRRSRKLEEIDTVSLLLAYGADPSQPVNEISPWQRLMTDALDDLFSYKDYVSECTERTAEFVFCCRWLEAFIRHGADLGAKCYYYGTRRRCQRALVSNTIMKMDDNPIIGASKMLHSPGGYPTSISLPTGAVARFLYDYYRIKPTEEVEEDLKNYATSEEFGKYMRQVSSAIRKSVYG